MNERSHPGSYVEHVAALERRLQTDDALRSAVGGEFLAIGKLEYQLLRSWGLRDGHTVVDVGCGSGRLAFQLAPFPAISYLGCDVVPRLLSYASDLCKRPDWTFAETSGSRIPCPDATADFACFFSVFTHLPHEDTFRYMREASRVLKPGGMLVMSFLEFSTLSHWSTFFASVDGTRADRHLNQFLDRGAIRLWAQRTGFVVRGIFSGDTNYIPLAEDVVYENGAIARGAASLGQSVAVLQRRDGDEVARTEAPLLNVAARVNLAKAGAIQIGFVVGGAVARRILVRAVGPSLRQFGVTDTLSRPVINIRGQGASFTPAGPGWPESLGPLFARVGAFPLPLGSTDAAAVALLEPGTYAAVIGSADATDAGEVLVEVYFVD